MLAAKAKLPVPFLLLLLPLPDFLLPLPDFMLLTGALVGALVGFLVGALVGFLVGALVIIIFLLFLDFELFFAFEPLFLPTLFFSVVRRSQWQLGEWSPNNEHVVHSRRNRLEKLTADALLLRLEFSSEELVVWHLWLVASRQ
jgi:hypothetical protein